MRGRIQIDRFAVENFRAIGQCDVELSPVTFFIGANASGKTTFVDALFFLKSATNSLARAVFSRGDVYSLIHHPIPSPSEISFVSFRLNISSSEGDRGEYGVVLRCRIAGSVSVAREECRITSEEGEQHYYIVTEGNVQGSSAVFPAVSPDRLFLAEASGLPEFRGMLDLFLDLAYNGPALPDSGYFEIEQRGRSLRGNPAREDTKIALRFRHLLMHQPDQLELIQQYLRVIAPPFERIEVIDKHGAPWLQFVENLPLGGEMGFDVSQASAGLVNSADMLLDLFELPGTGKPASPVVIEEPEALLHPGAIHVIRDAFLEASSIRQVLVTTHSPELLDDPVVRPEWIRTVHRDKTGTRIEALDAGTKSIIQDSLYTAGQLLRQGGLVTQP